MNQHSAIAVPHQRVPLRVSDVEMLDRRGAFEGYGKIELIEGELLHVNAEFRPHMAVKSELAYRVRRALEDIGSTLFVGIEGSVALSEHDLPQPDIILTEAPRGEGPVPGSSVALAIEVSDATLIFDLGRKLRSYAFAGLPEYWVVDVSGRVIHQMWEPSGAEYRQSRQIAFGSRIEAATIAGLGVETATL